jgi:hypothetical protein
MKFNRVVIAVISLAFMFVAMNIKAHEEKEKRHDDGHHEWQVPKEAGEGSNPIPPTLESISRGKDLYQQYCLPCHGAKGRGDGPMAARLTPKPTDLEESADHHSDGNLAWKIETGRPPMPAWKGTLSQDQIWDIVNYMGTLAKGSKK